MQIQMRKYEVIDAGVYPAEVVTITPETGQYGDQLRVKFLLEDEANTALTAWTSTSFSPKSKLYGLARAAFGGREFDPNYVLDTDKLIGRRLLLLVTVKPKADGSDYNKIEQFLPARPPKAAFQPAAQPATNGSQRQPVAPAVATEDEPPELWPDEAPAWLLSEVGDNEVPF